ncbi:MAG: hypothetical protein JWM78_2464 [Verrucomicrobiaceae bacterium]|nr:hypothetical protein [Verrucomicrobiaceae bacterium]
MSKLNRNAQPNYFVETAEGLLYREPDSTAVLRLVFGGAGIIAIVCSLFFVELIRQIGAINIGALIIGTPAMWAKAGGEVASMLGLVAFFLFGGYCLKMAVLLPRQTLLFDRSMRRVIYTARAPAQGQRRQTYSFDSICAVEIIDIAPLDDAPTFTIDINLSAQKQIQIGVFATREQALPYVQQIRKIIGHVSQH